MATRKTNRGQRPRDKSTSEADSGRPGGGQGRVDATGKMPEGIRIDPDITVGHPGYQESGDSEIIPNERLGGGQAAEEKESRG